MKAKSTGAVKAAIEAAVKSAMQNQVAQAVKDAEVESIQSNVYELYKKPKVYERRGSGGLGDPDNMVASEIDGGLGVSVKNVTPPNPYARDGATTNKDLPESVETGSNYDYPYEYAYNQPRPFTAKTKENLQSSGAHVEALRSGLVAAGLKVR